MEDLQEVKSKGQYNHWSEPEHKLLLRLLVDAINHGFRDANGKFNKLTVEKRVLNTLNQQIGATKTYSQYRNRMKLLTARYRSLADLLRFSSGFGWDPETKKFTADEEVWNDYLKAHPGNKHLREESFEDFEDLRTIFGQNIASGQNAMGLGDTTEKNTFHVKETDATINSSFVEIMDEAEGITYQQTSERPIFSSPGISMGEKLPQRKKARTDIYNLNKDNDEVNTVTEISSHIFGMMQKRWEVEAKEKEAEDKANNVWDAIKECHDLDEDLRYEAMTLVHSLGMKYGFVNMSIANRCGWIKRNLRKPS